VSQSRSQLNRLRSDRFWYAQDPTRTRGPDDDLPARRPRAKIKAGESGEHNLCRTARRPLPGDAYSRVTGLDRVRIPRRQSADPMFYQKLTKAKKHIPIVR
jgi:hypothetical protein